MSEYETSRNMSGLPTRAAGFARDLFERFAATAAEAGLAFAAVEIANAEAVYVPILTAALALVKGFLAKFVGHGDSASLDPSVKPVIVQV
jgi:hypothetical protein